MRSPKLFSKRDSHTSSFLRRQEPSDFGRFVAFLTYSEDARPLPSQGRREKKGLVQTLGFTHGRSAA